MLSKKPKNADFIMWEAQLLQDALRYVYQRVLVEPNSDVRAAAELVWDNLVENSRLVELLHASCPFITIWLCLSMQPVKVPFDPNFLICTKSHKKKINIDSLNNFDHTVVAPKLYIGGKFFSLLYWFKFKFYNMLIRDYLTYIFSLLAILFNNKLYLEIQNKNACNMRYFDRIFCIR